jgi:hypothetical protein
MSSSSSQSTLKDSQFYIELPPQNMVSIAPASVVNITFSAQDVNDNPTKIHIQSSYYQNFKLANDGIGFQIFTKTITPSNVPTAVPIAEYKMTTNKMTIVFGDLKGKIQDALKFNFYLWTDQGTTEISIDTGLADVGDNPFNYGWQHDDPAASINDGVFFAWQNK